MNETLTTLICLISCCSPYKSDYFETDFNLFPYGLPLFLLGCVMFSHGYWKARIGTDIDFKWIAVLVFGGLFLLTYGVYVISDYTNGSPSVNL